MNHWATARCLSWTIFFSWLPSLEFFFRFLQWCFCDRFRLKSLLVFVRPQRYVDGTASRKSIVFYTKTVDLCICKRNCKLLRFCLFTKGAKFARPKIYCLNTNRKFTPLTWRTPLLNGFPRSAFIVLLLSAVVREAVNLSTKLSSKNIAVFRVW